MIKALVVINIRPQKILLPFSISMLFLSIACAHKEIGKIESYRHVKCITIINKKDNI